MMSLRQCTTFPHPATVAAVTLVSSQIPSRPSPPPSRACCENGRPILTDPHTGQTICSCQYGPGLVPYTRVPALPEGVYGPGAYPPQGLLSVGAEASAFYSPLGNGAFELKENAEAWRSLQQAGGCFPYDPAIAMYPYPPGYGGLDLNGARRKNATRETTNTLKAWLYEHRKNPYPTKGEKIMLAIITKMTLTQVSTWFANARRRLKKENKMTWTPRNRTEDGGEGSDAENDNEKSLEKDDDDDDDDKDDFLRSPDRDDGSHDGDRVGRVDMDEDDDLLDDIDVDDSGDEMQRESLRASISRDPNHTPGSPDRISLNSSSDHVTSTCPRLSPSNQAPSQPSSREPVRHNPADRTDRPVSETQPKPKIWSITEVLNTDSGHKSSPQGFIPGRPIPPSQQPPRAHQGLSYLQSVSHSWLSDRLRMQGSYPIPPNHPALSYGPYFAAHAKASMVAASAGLVPRMEQMAAPKAHLVRPQGLFSPARDLDTVRDRFIGKREGTTVVI